MDQAMVVSVPVQLTGVPVGVKMGGGILSQVLHEVEIECLPGDIPSHIDVDVSELDLHGAIHIADLPHSDKITFLGEEDALVAHVTVMKEEVAAEPVAGPAEPEVAKKGKQDASDAAAAPAAKK
jgi:large subunit ribosomal protein L25